MNTYVNFTPFQYLIYYFASILGLAPFTVENNVIRPLGFRRKAYAVFLALLNAFLMFHMIDTGQPQDTEVSTVNRFVTVMLFTLSAMSLCSNVFTFAFKTDKVIEIWNGITAISDKVKKFRIDDNFGMSCTKFSMKIMLTNGILILTMTTNLIFNSNIRFFIWVGFLITSIHRFNAALIFSESIMCIKELFDSLNKRLQDAGQPNCNILSSDDQHGSSTAYRVVRHRGNADSTARRIISVQPRVQLCVKDVQEIGKLHGEICELVESVTNCFTVPILFNIVQNFNNLLLNSYLIYVRVFVSRERFENTDATVTYIVEMMTWMSVTLMESLLIAHACTSMSRSGNAIKALVHEVWNKYYPEELRDELLKFSVEILHKPIAVSALGFFDLGYSFMIKIFYALVAYLVIMIQLDASMHVNPGT